MFVSNTHKRKYSAITLANVNANIALNVCTEFVPIGNAAASPSAAERFSSPAAGTGAKRRLFDSGEGTAASSSSSRTSASDSGSQSMPIPMVLVADKTGRQVQPSARFLSIVYTCSLLRCV